MVTTELFIHIFLCSIDQQGCWVEFIIVLDVLYSGSIILIKCPNYGTFPENKNRWRSVSCRPGMPQTICQMIYQLSPDWGMETPGWNFYLYFSTNTVSHQQNLTNTPRLTRVGARNKRWVMGANLDSMNDSLWNSAANWSCASLITYTWPLGVQSQSGKL